MDLGTVVLLVFLTADAVMVPLVKFWLNPGRPMGSRDLHASDVSMHQISAMHFSGEDSGSGWSDGGDSGGSGGEG